MALVYKTTQHMRIGDAIAPPGTTITDVSARAMAALVDKGLVFVTDDSVGGGDINTVESSGADETLDGDTARYHEITLDANCTLTITNLDVGEQMVVYVKQDATGGRTLTIGGELTDAGADTLGGLDTTANAAHLLTLLQTSDGLAVLLAASSLA